MNPFVFFSLSIVSLRNLHSMQSELFGPWHPFLHCSWHLKHVFQIDISFYFCIYKKKLLETIYWLITLFVGYSSIKQLFTHWFVRSKFLHSRHLFWFRELWPHFSHSSWHFWQISTCSTRFDNWFRGVLTIRPLLHFACNSLELMHWIMSKLSCFTRAESHLRQPSLDNTLCGPSQPSLHAAEQAWQVPLLGYSPSGQAETHSEPLFKFLHVVQLNGDYRQRQQ